MIRVARGNGFKVHNFYAEYFGRERQIWNRDIDHHAPTWLLDGLEQHTGVQRERLEALTLRSFESLVFERLNETGITRLLMPLSIFHRTRRAYGQQFCPMCLAEDDAPYLRRRWRLAIMTVCSRHAILLQDRCGHCGRPLAPHRADMALTRSFPERSTIRQCAYCRSSIAGEAWPAARSDVETQLHVERVLDQGYVMLHERTPVYSHLYFDGLRQLMLGLSRCGSVRKRSYAFEHADVAERLACLKSAVALIKDWPTEFLCFCSNIRKPYTVFARDASAMPYWLDGVLRRHLLFQRARLSVGEAEAIVAASERVTGRSNATAARILSGRDINGVVPRPAVDEAVADVLIASIDHEIGEASHWQRLLLQRDKVMFIAARCLKLTVPQLLALETERFRSSDGAEFSFWERIDTSQRAAAMLGWYLHRLRPRLLQESGNHAFFTALGGSALKPSAVGSRFTRTVQRAGLVRAIPGWKDWVRRTTEGSSNALHT
jgi:hypothetical protein